MSISFLSEAKVQEIQEAALRILAEIGMRFGSGRAREMLAGAGCRVEKDVVKFSASVIDSALSRCPRQFAIAGRDGKRILIGDGALHAHPSGGCRDVTDFHTGQRRRATVADLNELVRLMDALPQFDIASALVTPSDVPTGSMAIHGFASAVRQTTKPLCAPGLHYAKEVRYLCDIIRAVRPQGDPIAFLPISPISPLNVAADDCEGMIEAAKLGLPLLMLPCPITGMTSPITLAGTLAQQHAETLAGVVLMETAKPGAVVVHCSRASGMNFRTGDAVMGSPEVGLMGACSGQLARRVGLPSNVYGMSTSALSSDAQAGYEKAMNVLVPALAGVDVVSGGGSLRDVVNCSFEQLAIDNELLGAVRRLRAGVEVNSDTLALDVIASVANGEQYMSHEHTVSHLRSGDTWIPTLSVRGEKDAILPRARKQVEELLEKHVVPPLPDEVNAEIQAILAEADKELST